MGERANANTSPAGAGPGANAPSAPAVDATSGVAQRRRAVHWRRDVGLPFLLGALTVAGWAGAFILTATSPTTSTSSPIWWAIRAAQAVLLAPPLLILLIGVPHAKAFWRETEPGLWDAPVRMVVAVLVILLGLAPAFFAVAPQPGVASGNQLSSLAIGAPGFSLGVALGFVWGAYIRPVFGGALVGWLGGLGFSAPIAAIGIISQIIEQRTAHQCHTAGYGCMVGAEIAEAVYAALIISPLIIGLVSIVGASVGAFLSGE